LDVWVGECLQWVTSTAPEHGLTNITVLLNGNHVVFLMGGT